jgi:hypothetical protein
VEVYFSGYGWVEFEPTSIQPEIVRREKPIVAGAGDAGQANREAQERDPDDRFGPEDEFFDEGMGLGDFGRPMNTVWDRLGFWVAMAMAGAIVLGMGIWAVRRRTARGSVGPVGRSYEGMYRSARLLGVLPQGVEHHTPLEVGMALQCVVPSGYHQIGTLTDHYVRHRYARVALLPAEIDEVQENWRALRGRLLGALLLQGMRSLGGAVSARTRRLTGGDRRGRFSEPAAWR